MLFRSTIVQHLRICYAFVIPVLIFFILFPQLILNIYTDMDVLIEASVSSLWVLCFAYLFLVPGNVYFRSVSGTGNTRTALLIECLTLVIYMAFCVYFILYLQMSVAFAWISEVIYGGFIGLFSYLYIKKGNWQKKKI